MMEAFTVHESSSERFAAARAEWVERSVRVRPQDTLELDLERAAVEVRAQRDAALSVQTRVSGWAEGGFDLERTEKGMRLSDQLSWGMLGSLFGRAQVRAFVPTEHSVDVRTGAGSVSASGIHGALALRSSDGDLAIQDVWGPVFAVTSSGAIAARGVHGELRAYTSDGSIEVEDAEGGLDVRTSAGWIGLMRVAGPVLARSSSGSMYVGFRGQPSGTLATSSGSIEIAVPADAAFELRAQAQGGCIEIDPALSRQASAGARSVALRVNGGGECLWLRTTGGNIYVRAEPATPESHGCGERF